MSTRQPEDDQLNNFKKTAKVIRVFIFKYVNFLNSCVVCLDLVLIFF